MITAIEQAVANVIEAALAEDTTVSAIDYEVLTMTRRTEAAQDRTSVVVSVQQGDRTQVQLIDLIAEILVATPARNEGTTLTEHRTMEAAVDRVFSPGTQIDGDDVKDVLATEIETLTDEAYTGGGFFNEGWTPGREDTMWMPTLRVKIGAVRE
jgi:hypothetical protein